MYNCAVSRGIHSSCNVRVTSVAPVPFQACVSVFTEIVKTLLCLEAFGWFMPQTSLNTCHYEGCLSSLKTIGIYKSLISLMGRPWYLIMHTATEEMYS